MPRPLEAYHQKRDFTRTAEPKGRPTKAGKSGALRYVIQRHAASHLHFDFRLEVDGVLKSWAVPKGPHLDPEVKRLAMAVEDHPLEYGSFEGIIPEKEYGGGTVQLWDRGFWRPSDKIAIDKAFKKGHIEFELDGKRLHGRWHLVRSGNPRYGKQGNAWLLIKGDDDWAVPGIKGDLSEIDASVASGRSIEEIARGDAPVWHSKDPAAKNAKRLKAAKAPAAETMPDFIEPQFARLEEAAPDGDAWVHEIKFDGYRTQLRISGGRCTAFTRTGLDWTARFPEIVEAAQKLPDCILDGEVVALAENGVSDFSALQLALSEEKTAGLVYFAFDLLYAHGEDLRGRPLDKRKASLRALLPAENQHLRYSDHFAAPGEAVRTSACRMALEGIISKKLSSPYRSGRGASWIKTKCRGRQEFVVGGYFKGRSDAGVGALLVGVFDGKKLLYRGRVGSGIGPRLAKTLLPQLEPLTRKTSPFIGTQPADKKNVVWLDPHLVAEVDYGGWSSDGLLRQASYKGLREDKPASAITGEGPASAQPKAAPVRTSKVVLSHPEKLLWSKDRITKQDLADYYAQMADHLLRYVGNRPISLLRAPDGIDKPLFFQRHHSAGMSNFIKKAKIRAEKEPYIAIDDLDGLQALAQVSAIEIHPWGAPVGRIERPEQLIFDLDPDDSVPFEKLHRAVMAMRAHLADLDLPSFPKLTGGKGVHVVVPLLPSANWAQAKAFTKAIAQSFERVDPQNFVATMTKSRRVGRIFIDYLRNARSATAIAPWSPRARPGAPIAVPITWDFFEKMDELTVYSMVKPTPWQKHLEAWDGFDAARVKLTPSMIKRVGAVT